MTVFDWNADTLETGPIFGGECEDLDFTLLQWRKGQGVAEHTNNEVDVIMIVLAGQGEVLSEGASVIVSAGNTLVLPKGTNREIRSTSDGFRYLNIHKRRKRLMPTIGRPRTSIS